VAIPQKLHTVTDDSVRARPTHKVGDREGVNDPGSREQIPGRLPGRATTWRCRSPLVVEIMKAAKRINDMPFEKRKKGFRFPQ
jgi:hypothetical protein